MKFFQLLCVLLFYKLLAATQNINVVYQDINSNITVNVSQSNMYIIIYNYTQSANDDSYLRAMVESFMEYGHSTLVILKDDDTVNSMKLSNYKNATSVKAARNICPVLHALHKDVTQHRTLMIEVSTETIKNISVKIQVLILKDFLIQLGTTRELTLDYMGPAYYLFKFDRNVQQVNVNVSSNSETCMILSIQEAECPVYDISENVKFKGMYQSVSKRGSVLVQRSNYKKNKFFLVFVVQSNDGPCTNLPIPLEMPSDSNTRSKTFYVNIDSVPGIREYMLPVFGVITFYLAFFVIAGIISLIYKRCFGEPLSVSCEEEVVIASPMNDPTGIVTAEEIADMKTLYSRRYRNNYNTFAGEADNSSTTSKVKTEDSDDISFDSLSDASNDPNVYRLNKSLYVSDLSKKHSAILNRKYFLYLWYLVIISVFYALPVVQLVITFQKAVSATGNEDMCYYNFDCTRPFYIFTAFNNIISNAGYVLLGLLFTLITWRRHSLYNECKLRLVRPNTNQGIPQYYGLFYAMGLALTMEGILSACYHICPSNTNFQFDTAYMYILACLCMIKIYQTRHPDVNASAHSFFMTMSFIIFLGVIGVIYNSLLFWIFFTMLYMLLCAMLTMEVYYMGRWTLDIGLPRRAYNVIRNDKWMAFIPIYKRRMIVLLILNVVNLTFAFYGGIGKPNDFASFFLAIFMLNLLLYFFFYIIMKMKHCEHFHVLPIIYVLIAIICWAFAIYCFIHHPTDWQLTPAKSRELNSGCIFLDFYDLHDVWHFLSSMSMFFSFLALQNLDDSLFNVPRDKIPVF